jgi:hypothetical protein
MIEITGVIQIEVDNEDEVEKYIEKMRFNLGDLVDWEPISEVQDIEIEDIIAME